MWTWHSISFSIWHILLLTNVSNVYFSLFFHEVIVTDRNKKGRIRFCLFELFSHDKWQVFSLISLYSNSCSYKLLIYVILIHNNIFLIFFTTECELLGIKPFFRRWKYEKQKVCNATYCGHINYHIKFARGFLNNSVV